MMSRMIDDEETLKDNGLIEIDGCNVAECKHFEDADCLNPAETVLSCEAQPDCLFKQLQRAKAELEQYKKSKQASYENMQAEWNKAVNELRDLKTENEKLKAELDKYKRID